MMFGEVGGLHDFIALVFKVLLGFFSQRFLAASLVEKLYHTAPKTIKKDAENALSVFKPLFFGTQVVLCHICTNGKRGKYQQIKTLHEGIIKVEDSLDVVKLLRHIRSLKVLT